MKNAVLRHRLAVSEELHRRQMRELIRDNSSLLQHSAQATREAVHLQRQLSASEAAANPPEVSQPYSKPYISQRSAVDCILGRVQHAFGEISILGYVQSELLVFCSICYNNIILIQALQNLSFEIFLRSPYPEVLPKAWTSPVPQVSVSCAGSPVKICPSKSF